MPVAKPLPMTVDAFVDWAMAQPKRARFELLDGEVVARGPQRNLDNVVRLEVALGLRRLAGSGPCTVLGDGATVRVDATPAFEPDVAVQ